MIETITLEQRGAMRTGFDDILTPEALAFVAKLAQHFEGRRAELLAQRQTRQARIDAGHLPDFLPETAHVRGGDWQIAPLPADLLDRRVEITGPTDRKMVINALNSGAKVFMADFEDANTPTWDNQIQGQINLRDAIRRTISFTNEAGKEYRLNEQTAVLMVRPRGWHLNEKHLLLDAKPIAGAFMDFGLYVFHNAHELLKRGSGPYFYLPKLESHLEARLWNDVFIMAQEMLGIPRGTIKATMLIETIVATFEAEEMLYELREHSAGLNCGRWDYIFSYIKKFRNKPEFMLPERAQVTMTVPFMRNYTQHIIKVCHRHGAPAMGGMAAQIPIKSDPSANEQALAKVRADKEREARDGHDGTWVAHPGLVPIAMTAFNEVMTTPNQIYKQREDVNVTAWDLLQPCQGTISQNGLRGNIKVGVQYLEAWLGGLGCVPLYNLMEDAATAEISRAQVWQWLQHGALLDDGTRITPDLFETVLEEEMDAIRREVGEARYQAGRYEQARDLFAKLSLASKFDEFLTLSAYELVD